MASLTVKIFKSVKLVSAVRASVCKLSGQAPSTTTTQTAKPPPAATDNSKYQVQEYYQYNIMSYYDIENDMSSFRIEQPSKYNSAAPKHPAK